MARPLEWPAGADRQHLGRRAVKRAFDLLFGVPLLAAALPVIALLGVLIRLDSRGSPYFNQRRVGRGGTPFVIWKLRTMHRDAEAWLVRDEVLGARYRHNGFKLEAGLDPRITRVGRLLRRTSLDELPQLFNVVGGTMSLVGPRPVLPDEVAVLYGERAAGYLRVKPGLTGPWQVSGRCALTGAVRVELDLSYAEQNSLVGDLWIVWRTIPAVLSQRGAH